ncbi:MAG: D-hexose-6-phosphate mutarotase, partial [Aeromonas veronii]
TMLCVEAAIAGEAGVTVAPDEEHSLSTVII